MDVLCEGDYASRPILACGGHAGKVLGLGLVLGLGPGLRRNLGGGTVAAGEPCIAGATAVGACAV